MRLKAQPRRKRKKTPKQAGSQRDIKRLRTSRTFDWQPRTAFVYNAITIHSQHSIMVEAFDILIVELQLTFFQWLRQHEKWKSEGATPHFVEQEEIPA